MYINGTKIPLSSPSIKSSGWLDISSDKVSIDGIETSRDIKVCCGKSTDTRIGTVLSKNENKDYFLAANAPLQELSFAFTKPPNSLAFSP